MNNSLIECAGAVGIEWDEKSVGKLDHKSSRFSNFGFFSFCALFYLIVGGLAYRSYGLGVSTFVCSLIAIKFIYFGYRSLTRVLVLFEYAMLNTNGICIRVSRTRRINDAMENREFYLKKCWTIYFIAATRVARLRPPHFQLTQL